MKAIPVMLIRMLWKLAKLTNAPLGIAIAQLVTLAFFFAMRSCEYSKTSSEEAKRTKIIRLRNIRFYKNNRLVPHASPNLHNADMVNITFEFQKNDERNESVGMFAAGADDDMCPVKVTAAIVRRVRGYTDIDADINDRKVNLFKNDKGKMTEITSATIRKKLRGAATSIGEARLGFKASEIGTHSIRSGAAMALFLAKVPTLTIMIIGRWRSDAFLRYIRKQVAQFSLHLSSKMLDNEEFFTTPDFINGIPRASEIPAPDLTNENGDPWSMGTYKPIAMSCQ